MDGPSPGVRNAAGEVGPVPGRRREDDLLLRAGLSPEGVQPQDVVISAARSSRVRSEIPRRIIQGSRAAQTHSIMKQNLPGRVQAASARYVGTVFIMSYNRRRVYNTSSCML